VAVAESPFLTDLRRRCSVRIRSPQCNHIWNQWEDKQRRLLMLKCDNCGYMEAADNTRPVYENYVVKQDQDILGAISPYTGQDPTLHQHTLATNARCKKCGHNEVVHFQADAGAKVQSLKLAYVCKNCGHSWLMHGGEEEEFDGGFGNDDLDDDDDVAPRL
jgi:DNA-directed RNA polymerase II subunit RPB9